MAKHILTGKSVMLPLHEGPEMRMHNWWDREEKKSTWQDLNPWPLCHEACALLLCYNCYPKHHLWSLSLMSVLQSLELNGNSFFLHQSWPTSKEATTAAPSLFYFYPKERFYSWLSFQALFSTILNHLDHSVKKPCSANLFLVWFFYNIKKLTYFFRRGAQ